MKSRFKTLFFLFFFILVLSIGSPVWAQSGGTLGGTVLDNNEKFPLPTVRINLVGTDIYSMTDEEGVFSIKNINTGVYKVTFELSGYLTTTKKNVIITAGQMTELNVKLKMGFSHEVTVTARREVESLQRVPQNIEVLTTTELEETPYINIVQALNTVSGVDVFTGSGITGVGTFMSINGYDDVYIRKMVDGVDITAVITNWSMLNAYPMEMMEQIEVIKGGTSSVWGSNMGGIINVVTKRPSDMERAEFSIKGTFGSFGEMDFANASGIGQKGQIMDFSLNAIGAIDKFGYMLGYKRDNHDLFTDYGKEKNYNIFAKFGYDFSDSTYVDFLYSKNKIGSSGHSFLETDMFLAWGFPYYWNYLDDATANTQVGYLKFSTMATPALNLEAQVKYSRMDGDFTRTFLEGAVWGVPGTVTNSTFMDQRLGVTVKGSYNPSDAFSLVSGVDYYRIKADFSDFIDDQPIIYVDTVAPFINSVLRLGAFGLHAGARYDYDSSFGSQLSPSIGANINLFNSTIFRVNVARTFKVPDLWYTLGESYMDAILPNPDLRPERAWAYSAGFESQEFEYVWVKFSVYLHKMQDGIVRISSPDVANRFTWGNDTEFTRKGYEAELGVMTPFGLKGYIGTNYNRHVDETAEGEILGWLPTRTYKTGLKYSNEKLDFFVNVRGRWVWWNEDLGLTELFEPRDKIWQFDLRLTKGITAMPNLRIELFMDVYNLFDVLYWDRKDSPNPRRWARVGFEIKFK